MNVHKPKNACNLQFYILYYAFLHYSYNNISIFNRILKEFNYLSSVKDETRILIKNNGINLLISILSLKIIFKSWP